MNPAYVSFFAAEVNWERVLGPLVLLLKLMAAFASFIKALSIVVMVTVVVIGVVFVVGLVFLLRYFWKRRSEYGGDGGAGGGGMVRHAPLAEGTLEVGREGIARRLAGGLVERMDWGEIGSVTLVTRGPSGSGKDPVLVIVGTKGAQGFLLPWRHPQMRFVLGKVSGLPGFDGGRLAEGLQASAAQRYVLWEKSGPAFG